MADAFQLKQDFNGNFQPRKSNLFDQRDLGGKGRDPISKFDLGPRWSSEEIEIFFESKNICQAEIINIKFSSLNERQRLGHDSQ